MAFGAFTEGTREWKMNVPLNVLGSISISMDIMCVRCKTNVLTVDTMWTVQDKCERTHESFGGDVGARC